MKLRGQNFPWGGIWLQEVENKKKVVWSEVWGRGRTKTPIIKKFTDKRRHTKMGMKIALSNGVCESFWEMEKSLALFFQRHQKTNKKRGESIRVFLFRAPECCSRFPFGALFLEGQKHEGKTAFRGCCHFTSWQKCRQSQIQSLQEIQSPQEIWNGSETPLKRLLRMALLGWGERAEKLVWQSMTTSSLDMPRTAIDQQKLQIDSRTSMAYLLLSLIVLL